VQDNYLYHMTSALNAFSILSDNALKTFLPVEKDDETLMRNLNSKGFRFASLCRIPAQIGSRPHYNIYFILDKSKLKANYKIIPAAYFKKLPHEHRFEYEERLITKQQNIPNFSKYIVGISIFYGNAGVETKEFIDKTLVPLSEKMGIPVYVYFSKKS